jgi:soluble lytic murein transglycosylase-like protein
VRFVALLALLPLLPAAEPGANLGVQDIMAAMAQAAEQQRTAVQAMSLGIERQRQSVRGQLRESGELAADPADHFTIPWPKAPVPASMVVAECDPLPDPVVDALVDDSARRESLSPALLREVIRRESGFRNCAVSRSGAEGLMQLMPATARQFGVRNVFDPRQNVAAGARFLRALIDRYEGDLTLALGAYNAGPGRVDETGGVPAIQETQDYISSILSAVAFH